MHIVIKRIVRVVCVLFYSMLLYRHSPGGMYPISSAAAAFRSPYPAGLQLPSASLPRYCIFIISQPILFFHTGYICCFFFSISSSKVFFSYFFFVSWVYVCGGSFYQVILADGRSNLILSDRLSRLLNVCFSMWDCASCHAYLPKHNTSQTLSLICINVHFFPPFQRLFRQENTFKTFKMTRQFSSSSSPIHKYIIYIYKYIYIETVCVESCLLLLLPRFLCWEKEAQQRSINFLRCCVWVGC